MLLVSHMHPNLNMSFPPIDYITIPLHHASCTCGSGRF